MAFGFFGVFTRAQWYDFKDFTAVQRVELEARKRWIDAELNRVGKITCVYNNDGMTPTSFTASPNTYSGKLLMAYRILGGIPEQDMLLRRRDQVVFLNRGADESDRPKYSNGRMDRGTQRFDRPLGLKVEMIKRWQLEAIKAKREQLEFKIKRAMDYADQLEQESELIGNLLDGFGIDDQIIQVEAAINEPNQYRIPDGIGDRFGNEIGVIGDGTMTDAGTMATTENQRVPQG